MGRTMKRKHGVGMADMAEGRTDGILGKGLARGAKRHLPITQEQNVGRVVHGGLPVMRDEDHGRTVILPAAVHQGVEVGAARRIHAGLGFIQQDEGRPTSDRSGQVNPLQFAPRQDADAAIGQVRGADTAQGLERCRTRLGR